MAVGLDTSGVELVATFADACGSVNDPFVSGSVAPASALVGAVTTGWLSAAPVTAAGACEPPDFGDDVEALAPDLLAEAELDPPADGLVTCTVVGDETLGLVTTDVEPAGAGGVTLTVAGAVTWG